MTNYYTVTLLLADHGFPVRMIIPGFIGGRMVKFLSEITVTVNESDNFYHYYDNRVMPAHVDDEVANKEGRVNSHCLATVRFCSCFGSFHIPTSDILCGS